jgi:hypothetical protein
LGTELNVLAGVLIVAAVMLVVKILDKGSATDETREA